MNIFENMDLKGSSIKNSPSILWKFTKEQYEAEKDNVPDGSTVAIIDEVELFEKVNGALKPYSSSSGSIQQSTILDAKANTTYDITDISLDATGKMMLQLYKLEIGDKLTADMSTYTSLDGVYHDNNMNASTSGLSIKTSFTKSVTTLSTGVRESELIDRSNFTQFSLTVEE